mgnify:CR=1 FL=1
MKEMLKDQKEITLGLFRYRMLILHVLVLEAVICYQTYFSQVISEYTFTTDVSLYVEFCPGCIS